MALWFGLANAKRQSLIQGKTIWGSQIWQELAGSPAPIMVSHISIHTNSPMLETIFNSITDSRTEPSTFCPVWTPQSTSLSLQLIKWFMQFQIIKEWMPEYLGSSEETPQLLGSSQNCDRQVHYLFPNNGSYPDGDICPWETNHTPAGRLNSLAYYTLLLGLPDM